MTSQPPDPTPTVIEVTYQLDIVRQVLLMKRRRWMVRLLRHNGLSDHQLQRLERWMQRRMQRLGWTYIGPMEASVVEHETVPGHLRPDRRPVDLFLTDQLALVLRAKVAWGQVPVEHRGLLYAATGQIVKLRVPNPSSGLTGAHD